MRSIVTNEKLCAILDDVGYDSWSIWGECSRPCGLGTQVRQRICLNEKNCVPGGGQQTRTCNSELCPTDGGKICVTIHLVNR